MPRRLRQRARGLAHRQPGRPPGRSQPGSSRVLYERASSRTRGVGAVISRDPVILQRVLGWTEAEVSERYEMPPAGVRGRTNSLDRYTLVG